MADVDPPTFQRLGFVPSDSAEQLVLEIERKELAMPSFAGFADIARDFDLDHSPGFVHIADERLLASYFDALLDLHRLVEEYRFHVALAHLLVLDIKPKISQGAAEEQERDPIVEEHGGLPDEARALLLPFMREPPSAVELFVDPHVLTAGGRRFSGWVAGQMLDGALIRGVAALDRIATMAWARTARPYPRNRSGDEFLPEFSERRFGQIADHYGDDADWLELRALASHILFVEVRQIRDGFTHTRRMPAELHGEHQVSRFSSRAAAGIDAVTHLALGLGFYDLVLAPAINVAGRLFALPPTEPASR